jgi:cytochrome P450
MEVVANAMVDRWTDLSSDHEFDVATEMAELTAEIISRTVFGRNLGAQAARMVVDGFTLYQKSIDPFNLGYFLGADEGWPIVVGPTKRKAIGMVHSVVDSVITAHLEGSGDTGSMIDLMVKRNQRNPELQLDVTALRNEAATIFLAGSESTATTLTWSWYMLDNAPWVADAMHAEIDAVCGDRVVTMDDLPKLNWCRAVVQEALRLYPPFPIVPRQARDADRIAHVDVEKGALIMIVPWLLHRAGDLWDRPNHFLPERFLNNARFDPYTYMPFSVGPRICAGMNFGLNEAILCLATLAQKFRVRVKQGYTAEPVCRLTLRSAQGMPATIAPRAGGLQ